MRKFWLENSRGLIWDLTSNNKWDKTASFFASPEGLGIKTKISSYEVENTLFIEEIATQTQAISGTMYFTDYDHFQRFVAFVGNVNSDTPMKFYYSVDGISHQNKMDIQWYKFVLITELKKGEIDIKSASLKVSVKFECLSRWRKDKEIVLKMAITDKPITKPFIYPFFYQGVNYLAVEIDNTGNLPTSCTVRVDGLTETPTFRVLQEGKIVDQARYDLTININEYLLIDSSAEKQQARLYTSEGNVVKDIYYLGEKDYSYSNFITIPAGASLFMITGKNETLGQVTLSYSIQRELV